MTCLKRETALPSRSGVAGADHNAAAVMRPRALEGVRPAESDPTTVAMQPRAPAATPRDARNGARVKHANVPPEGVYLPNNNRLAPHMRSPAYVQISTAAAILASTFG